MRKYMMFGYIVLIVSLAGCAKRAPQFHQGQIVYSVLNGQAGQITQLLYHPSSPHYEYKVRFAVPVPATPRHILGSGGDLTTQAFSTIWMWEYELTDQDPAG